MDEDIIRQLNLLSNNHLELDYNTSKKYNSLFSVINKTNTYMGKRELKNRLIIPISNSNIINKRYKLIELMIPHVINVTGILKKLKGDTCKLHRKLNMGRLDPSKLNKLYESYNIIYELFYYCIHNIYTDTKILKISVLDILTIIIDQIYDVFNLKEVKQINMEFFNSEIDLTKSMVNIFKHDIHTDLDDMKDELDTDTILYTKMTRILSLLLLDNNRERYEKLVSKPVEIKTDRKRKCFKMTASRYKKLLRLIDDFDMDSSCMMEIKNPKVKKIIHDFIKGIPNYEVDTTKSRAKIDNKNINDNMNEIMIR